MGLFDESAAFFEALLKKENYTEEEKAYFRDFSEKSPVYGDKLTKTWEKIVSNHNSAKLATQEEVLSDAEYKELYDVLKNSGLGDVEDFNLIKGAVEKNIDQSVVTKGDLDRWGKELDVFTPRVPGTQAMDDANDYIAEEFKKLGIDTWKEPIDFRGVFFHDWSLDIESPEKKHITSFPNIG